MSASPLCCRLWDSLLANGDSLSFIIWKYVLSPSACHAAPSWLKQAPVWRLRRVTASSFLQQTCNVDGQPNDRATVLNELRQSFSKCTRHVRSSVDSWRLHTCYTLLSTVSEIIFKNTTKNIRHRICNHILYHINGSNAINVVQNVVT